jgi:uncharacterized metal-binding protein YceD (DUF177 family)
MDSEMKQFAIQFVGLKNGKHEYDFQIRDDFFEKLDYSAVKAADVQVRLILEKQSHGMRLDFVLKGSLRLPCDRCSEPFDFDVQGNQSLHVKMGDEPFDETDEVIVLSKNVSEIDVEHHIYEFIMLMIPLRVVHPENEKGLSACNPEVLEKLGRLSVVQESIDPRWEALKKINLQ